MDKMTLAEFARRIQFNAKKIDRKIVAMFEKTTLTGEELEQMIPAKKTANKKQALPAREIVARFAAPPEEYRKVLRGVYLNTEDNTIVATNGQMLAVASDLIHKGENSNGCYEPIDVKFFADMEIKENFLKANETLSISKKMYVKNDNLSYPNYKLIIPDNYQYCMDCKSLIDKIPYLKALYHFGLNFGNSADYTNGLAVKLNLKCEKTAKEQTTVFKTENLLRIMEALKDTGLKNESKIYFSGNPDCALFFENSKIKIVAMPIMSERLKMEYIPTPEKMNQTGITHKTEFAPGCFMEMVQEEQKEPAPVIATENEPAPVESNPSEMSEAPAPVETETVKTEETPVATETKPESIVSCSMYADQSYSITIKTDIARIDGKTPMRAYKTLPAEYAPVIATETEPAPVESNPSEMSEAPAPVETETVKTEEVPAPVETKNRNDEKQTRYKFYCRRENDLNFIRLRAEMDGKTYPPEPVRKTDKLKNLYGGIAKTTAKVAAAVGAFLVNLP